MSPGVKVSFRQAAGLLGGMLTGLAGLGWVCCAVLVGRDRARPVTARLIAIERARLAACYRHRTAGGRGGLAYLAQRGALGLLGGYLALSGLFLSALFLYGGAGQLISGGVYDIPLRFPGVRVTGSSGVYGIVFGLVCGLLSVLWSFALIVMECRLAERHLGPDSPEAMRRRIAELTTSRSGIVRAVDDERRRIERDLHDGVQQRGVALAMLLGRLRQGAEPGLIDQAYQDSRLLLDELRAVAWRIYPTALDELGLRTALEEVAYRSAVPVSVGYALGERPRPEIETAVYFVAREAITNATKHAGAREILVELRRDEEAVVVTISDDGRGGADPAGGGLSGLARRVRALDGSFEVDSPVGGPTKVTARLPCG
jgi:signal transduction histidine kinase